MKRGKTGRRKSVNVFGRLPESLSFARGRIGTGDGTLTVKTVRSIPTPAVLQSAC